MTDLREEIYFCEKCRKALKASNFYISNNLEKYPNEGKLNQCKNCLTLHVDNWDPETYLWILEEIDVPYVPEEWNKLLSKYGRDRAKVTGTTILGRYLAAMKLKQWRDYRWADTAYIQEQAEAKIKQTMKRQGYSASEIDEVINTAAFPVPEKPAPDPLEDAYDRDQEDYFAEQAGVETQLDLTEEDKLYLLLKWGKSYRPEEWVRLEQLYEEMMNSYDIQLAGHIDTLKLVCKTSLKANQLLDIGDVDGAQKMTKMYDSLMKSGKFTAQQNKEENGEYVDSISELVMICETEGFIPRFYTDGPQDKVDRTLQDLQSYTRTLVTEEMNLGSLIEGAVKQIELDKIKEAEEASEAASDEELMEASLFNDSAEQVLQYNDYEEFREFEFDSEDEDKRLLEHLLEMGDEE